MKKLLAAVLVSAAFVFGANAQNECDAECVSGIKSDYRQVRGVVRVKVEKVELVEDRGYVTYAADGKIVESFKGAFKRGQRLKYYFIAEAGYDVKWYAKDSIIFLEGTHPVKSQSAEKGWFELENSHREPSVENISIMRRIKTGQKKSGKRRPAIRRVAKRAARAS